MDGLSQAIISWARPGPKKQLPKKEVTMFILNRMLSVSQVVIVVNLIFSF